MPPDHVEVVSLTSTNRLRGGKLLQDISGVFGADPFLTLDGRSGATLRQQLRDALGSKLIRVMTLFRLWDENGDGKISKEEFRRALARLLDTPPSNNDSDALFDEIDLDGSGTIEYRELSTLLQRHKSDRGLQQPRRASKATRPKSEAGVLSGERSTSSLPDTRQQLESGSREMPHVVCVSHSVLRYARSEAVLSQPMRCPKSSKALSRRRVTTLNQIVHSVERVAERDGARHVLLTRHPTHASVQAEMQLRAERYASAEARAGSRSPSRVPARRSKRLSITDEYFAPPCGLEPSSSSPPTAPVTVPTRGEMPDASSLLTSLPLVEPSGSAEVTRSAPIRSSTSAKKLVSALRTPTGRAAVPAQIYPRPRQSEMARAGLLWGDQRGFMPNAYTTRQHERYVRAAHTQQGGDCTELAASEGPLEHDADPSLPVEGAEGRGNEPESGVRQV